MNFDPYFLTSSDPIDNRLGYNLAFGLALTHWGRVIYASVKHTNIASDNGLSPVRRQAIIWINAAILSIV